MSNLLNRTLEEQEVAGVCAQVLDGLPADEHDGALRPVFTEFTKCGYYAAVAAYIRWHYGAPEGRIYNLLMACARHHGHDEGLVFEAVYGLYERTSP